MNESQLLLSSLSTLPREMPTQELGPGSCVQGQRPEISQEALAGPSPPLGPPQEKRPTAEAAPRRETRLEAPRAEAGIPASGCAPEPGRPQSTGRARARQSGGCSARRRPIPLGSSRGGSSAGPASEGGAAPSTRTALPPPRARGSKIRSSGSPCAPRHPRARKSPPGRPCRRGAPRLPADKPAAAPKPGAIRCCGTSRSLSPGDAAPAPARRAGIAAKSSQRIPGRGRCWR